MRTASFLVSAIIFIHFGAGVARAQSTPTRQLTAVSETLSTQMVLSAGCPPSWKATWPLPASGKSNVDAKVKLKEAFDAAKVPAEVEVYGSQHGWCVRDMPLGEGGKPIYNMPDAEKAWGKLVALYKTSLA